MKKIFIIFACFLFLFLLADGSHANNDIREFENQTWEYIPGDLPSGRDNIYNFDLAEGWQSYQPGDTIEQSTDYSYIWLRVKLPDYDIDNPTLYLPGVLAIEYPFPYQLYLNGDQIYENGSLEGKLRLPENYHSLVSLPQNWQDKYLYFRFYNNNRQFTIGEEIIASISSYQNLIDDLFSRAPIGLIFALIYLLLGIFAGIIYFFRLNEKIYLYLALFLLATSIYTILYNQIFSVVFNQWNYSFYLIYYFSIFVLAGSFSFLISQIISSKEFLYKAIGYSYLITLVLAVFSYLLHPPSMFTFLKFYNISIIIFSIFTFAQILKIFLVDKEELSKEILILLTTISFLGIIALILVFDMLAVQYDIQIFRDQFDLLSYNLLSYGIFFVVLSLLFIVGRRFSAVYTDLVQYSEKLEEANKNLSKLDHFKDKFITTTLKEFKLPLYNIISAAESVIRNNVKALTVDSKKDLAGIIKGGQGLNYLFDSFIDYADIKKGTIESETEDLELNQIIDYIIEFFKPMLSEKDIKVENNIEKEKFIIVADKGQLIQAIYNLLEYVTVSIDSAEISFMAEKANNKIKIKLKIEANKILFKYKSDILDIEGDSLFITDLNDLRQFIIQQLIKKQGGDFEVEKLANRSLLFTISLPGLSYDNYQEVPEIVDSIRSETIEKENKLKYSPNNSKETILIIGEKSSDIEFLKNILIVEDYNIQFVDKKEDIKDILNEEVALIIINLFSLDQSTLKLCKIIRDDYMLFELPILVVLARSEPDYLIQGFEIGINDFIQKPFTSSELKAKVRNMVILKEKVKDSIQQKQNFLRAQIKPHFLYNTLGAIAYLCENNPAKASKLVLELSSYLRYSFDFDSLNKQVSIKKELELIDFYLNIQKARFGDKITVKYNLAADLIFTVPPLIIQPLVENAVKHGLLSRENGGNLEICISELKDYFEIKVIDDGPGMSEEELKHYLLKNDNKEREKVGLKNINHRLKRIYNQQLEVENTKRAGTTIKFKIPKQG
ncbi:histidine kinase [Halanaerobium hydrogeniformans]|uniref:Stage 0 sporulation protein A homolog n=1 Tax=Halanaerobium hydrogeniformans TaxID=656519 RepID=E4RPH5_HALHG|nr:histidine kinase [Halanaerobium hydrogeniformans]ADQ13998.1 signal transduction histidine kinase, LytS [Halanaerobium hydrogeniformans]